MERDLDKVLLEGEIPKLRPVDEDEMNYNNDLWTLYAKTEDYDEMIEVAKNKYIKRTLDTFSKVLTSDDPKMELLDNEYFKLNQEDKFFRFIEEVFELNKRKCYIDLGVFSNKAEVIDLLTNLKRNLDQIDGYILFNQVDILEKSHQSIYLIDDVNLLKLIFKCFLREKLWNALYFGEIPMIIKTNYDINLPIIFENKRVQKIYEEIANCNQLFLL
ncbi:hypothetical protein IW492_11325 [Enterococcus sp. BWB1-3]|uniref:hypothetical protein n=1 Tax=Enterococcus sp. BWB1-3 TaxID=2787713 RepID=UPI0019241186|nr:hypothetical protein [Enterococcus sp. BWB1-3]MBL1229822.1 hypothetical protein [Enterococcus sp. BWB1-3]